MVGPSWDSLSQYFPIGGPIEIGSDEEGFRGSWYRGTLLRPPTKRSTKVLVQYSTLTDGGRPLRERLELGLVRPAPPPERRPASFAEKEKVDAYTRGGWWEGVVKEVRGDGVYKVLFRWTWEEEVFAAAKLRLHRRWRDGEWSPPLLVASADEDTPPPKKVKVMEVMEYNFSPEELVEVRSDEEGFVGSWYAATVIKPTSQGKYLIEHSDLLNEEETDLLREEVDGLNLRPSPPVLENIDSFEVHDRVDAWYNDGWWEGTVYKIHKNDRYSVYFQHTGDESKFEHSDLRVHQEWINGEWHTAPKALNL